MLLLFIEIVHLLLKLKSILSFGPLTVVKLLLSNLLEVVCGSHVYGLILGLLESLSYVILKG